MSHNTSALYMSDYGVRVSSYSNEQCQGNTYSEEHFYGRWFSGCHILAIVPISSQTTATGDTIIYSGKLNLVKELDSYGAGGFIRDMQLGIRSIYFGSHELIPSQSPNITTYFTRWSKTINGIQRYFETLTIVWTITANNNQITNTSGAMRVTFYNNNHDGKFDQLLWADRNSYYYFENTGEDPTIIFVDTGSQGTNTIINQNNISINQNEQIINQNKEYYNHEYEAEDNISSQNTSDIQGAENAQTTSIIGTISSFVGAFSNISPSQNCEMDLPFPDFVGGNQRVNICQGKDKAPAIITIASSLLLILTFVPVAFVVLSMIYREIRSFTNG